MYVKLNALLGGGQAVSKEDDLKTGVGGKFSVETV